MGLVIGLCFGLGLLLIVARCDAPRRKPRKQPSHGGGSS